MARNFIEETINHLRFSAENADRIWKQFQAGEIDKEEFEDNYTNIICKVVEDVRDEEYNPNNDCKYHETCPTSEYFKEKQI